jgi:hypothetical protein
MNTSMTPEEHADNIAKWTNDGLREMVIDAIAAAVRAEREACAKVAEDSANERRAERDSYAVAETDKADSIAAAIRARNGSER